MKNGIEVILDVVFNHTAEGNEKGPYFSFKGISIIIFIICLRRRAFITISVVVVIP